MSGPRAEELLRRIGWRGDTLPEGRVMRVVAQHRGGYEAHDGETQIAVQPDSRFLKPRLDPTERPMVGDFVTIVGDSPPMITRVLPRRSVLSRLAAGDGGERQFMASNIDWVLVLTGLDGDFSANRIERYLSLIEGSDAKPVVLLSKVDRRADSDAVIAGLRLRLRAEVPIHAVNGTDASCLVTLAPYLQPGVTAVLVGSSGAGKSTLTNTLLGEDQRTTGGVREKDSQGRHTTTHRALVQLASGACLIDTPGMRELKQTDEEKLDAFADVQAAIERCRFSDCSHANEPGCEVQAALAAGTFTREHFSSYIALVREQTAHADAKNAQLARAAGRARPTRGKGQGQGNSTTRRPRPPRDPDADADADHGHDPDSD